MKTIFDYTIYSTLIHSLLFFPLSFASGNPGKNTTEITVLTTPKSSKINTQSSNTHSRAKYAKSRRAANLTKSRKVESYKDLLESIVVPRFLDMYSASNTHFPSGLSTILLIYLDEHGSVLDVNVKQLSGNKEFDTICIKSIPETLPEPVPNKILLEGIEWSFSN